MITIFLPAYNEAIALPRVVQKFSAVLEAEKKPYRFVVLDDGSKDDTASVAEELSKKYSLELLRHPVNRGLGATLRDGIEHVVKISRDEDLVVMLDCDDTHEPQFLPAAIEKLKQGYDVVLLSRFCEGGGNGELAPIRRILSMGAGVLMQVFFPIKGVREYSCCYRVFRATILKKAIRVFGKNFIELPHMGFVAAPEILVKLRMLNARMAESPFVLRYDQKPGKSKNRPFKTIVGYFALVLKCFGRRVENTD